MLLSKRLRKREITPRFSKGGLLLAVIILALPTTLVAAPELNRHRVNFSGDWELDYQLSDHPNEKIRSLYTQARAEAERQMERARNNRSFRIDPQIRNYHSIIGMGRLAQKIAQATVLDITQEDGHIVVNRNDDFALICDFETAEFENGPIGVEACGWQEDQLAFQIALPDGLTVLHRFSIAADRSRLNIATTVHISGSGYPFTLNRVYMPYEPGEGMYHCEFKVASQKTCTLSGSGSSAGSGADPE